MAQAVSPAARMRASSAWISTLSGVVCVGTDDSPPTRSSTVPMTPQGIPAACSTECARYAEVVLPLVPVMPTTVMCAEGSPSSSAAIRAIATRESGTTTCGTSRSSGRCTTNAEAPRETASAAYSWPSPDTRRRRPG